MPWLQADVGEDDTAVEQGARAGGEVLGEGEPRADTVKFNVGGRIFEVLREPTLSLHPGTLLSTLAEEHSGDDPIFVEANPELFPYILQYLRSRSIHIPITVSKGAVLAEAAMLGINSIADEDINRDMTGLGALCDEAKTILNEVRARHLHFLGLMEENRSHFAGLAILSVVSDKVTKTTAFNDITCTSEELGEASGLKTDVVVAILRDDGPRVVDYVREHGIEIDINSEGTPFGRTGARANPSPYGAAASAPFGAVASAPCVKVRTFCRDG